MAGQAPGQYVRELLSFSKDPIDLKNQEIRDEIQQKVAALATSILSPQDKLQEQAQPGNRILLLAGQYGQATWQQDDTVVQGQPGCQASQLWSLTGTAIRVVGVDFTGLRLDPLVSSASTLVYFDRCTFTKTPGVAGTYVDIPTGGRAIFTNCTFNGAQPSGNPISNAGGAGNVAIIGGANLTGQPHLNVTVIWEF